MEYSGGFEKANARRVRLLLDRDGRMNIEDQVVMPSVGCEARAFLSRQRTDSRDAMLFHKTTHRPLYARAFKEAVDAGFDDLLFMNERDEVTESINCDMHFTALSPFMPVISGSTATFWSRLYCLSIVNDGTRLGIAAF